MNRKALKERAKEHLKGNWGIAIVGLLIISLVDSFAGLPVLETRLVSLEVLAILLLPIYVGYARMHYNMAKGQEGKLEDMIPMFNQTEYGRALIGMILYYVFLFGWFLLLIIPGIYKAFSYAMTVFILQDPEFNHLSGNQAITKSREMMNGHKLEFFDLLISFILWYLLIIVTLGLASLYVTPYVMQTISEFYLELKKENNL